MRRTRGALLAAVVGGLGAVIWIALQQSPLPRTPLEERLGFIGPVRRIVEVQTHEGGWAGGGTTSIRSVTDIAQDGRSATASATSEYRSQDGRVTTSSVRRLYRLSGRPERLTLKVTRVGGGAPIEETVSYRGRCAVLGVTYHPDPQGRSATVESQTCDSRGRLLTAISRTENRVTSRSTQRWLGGRLSIGWVWNAGFERWPATTHWVVILVDGQGSGRVFSPVVNVSTRYSSDQRGNWVRRTPVITPVPASGQQTENRRVIYWDQVDPEVGEASSLDGSPTSNLGVP